jgi:ABC-type transporter Mla MlaB component
MIMQMTVNTVHLEGNWTLKAVTQHSINAMSGALQQIQPDDGRKLRVDCRKVSAIDAAGQQLIDVWINCAKMRGFEPELVNLPDNLRHFFKL